MFPSRTARQVNISRRLDSRNFLEKVNAARGEEGRSGIFLPTTFKLSFRTSKVMGTVRQCVSVIMVLILKVKEQEKGGLQRCARGLGGCTFRIGKRRKRGGRRRISWSSDPGSM